MFTLFSSKAGICGALALGCCLSVYAEETNPTGDQGVLDEVIVWGTKVQSDLLSLSGDDISLRQADHLSDLLRTVPGVDIGGTHSVNSRINIRGLDDRELDIYIDGALQTNYLFHHIGNLLINADILRSADIQVGANSVVNGGIGGAVRFESKHAKDFLQDEDRKAGARLMASYNDNAKTGLSGTGYAQLSSQIDALVYFQQEDRDNFEDGSGRETIGSDGETDNLLLKLGYEPTEKQRIQLSYDRLEDSGDYTARPDMGVLTNSSITGDLLLPTEYLRETTNLSYQLDLGERFTLDATYYINDLALERDETNPAYRTRTGNTRKEAKADNQGLNLLMTSVLNSGVEHRLTYGLQYFDQDLSYVQDLDATTPAIVQNAKTQALFVEDEIAITEQFSIRPGVRYTDHEVNYQSTGESASFNNTTFGLAANFAVTENLALLASFTEIFQGSELAEPFVGAGGNKISNPDLQAEEGDNIEFGFKYSADLVNGSIGLGANIFRTTIDGYIGEASVAGSTTGETQDVNLGGIEIDGFEASLQANFGNFGFFLTHNRSDFDTSELQAEAVSESFREVGDTTSYEFSYLFAENGISLVFNGQFIQDKTTSLDAEKEGYDVHNVMARWTEPLGTKNLELTFGVDNLFDETYTSHASRVGETVHPVFGQLFLNDVEPGRNVKASLAFNF